MFIIQPLLWLRFGVIIQAHILHICKYMYTMFWVNSFFFPVFLKFFSVFPGGILVETLNSFSSFIFKGQSASVCLYMNVHVWSVCVGLKLTSASLSGSILFIKAGSLTDTKACQF